MRNYRLNRQAIQERFGLDTRFKQIIEELEADYMDVEEVICSIELNGKRLNEKEEIEWAHLKSEHIFLIELSTAKADSIARMTVRHWHQLLPALQERNAQLAAQIRFEDLGKIDPHFLEHMESVGQLVEAISLATPHLSNQDVRLQHVESMFRDAVGLLLKSFESGIPTQISDILHFELGSSLDNLKQILDHLVDDRHLVDKQQA